MRMMVLVFVLAACGDDGSHTKPADAPQGIDSRIDTPPSPTAVTPAAEVTSGATHVQGSRFTAEVQIGHPIDQRPAKNATRSIEANSAVKL